MPIHRNCSSVLTKCDNLLLVLTKCGTTSLLSELSAPFWHNVFQTSDKIADRQCPRPAGHNSAAHGAAEWLLCVSWFRATKHHQRGIEVMSSSSSCSQSAPKDFHDAVLLLLRLLSRVRRMCGCRSRRPLGKVSGICSGPGAVCLGAARGWDRRRAPKWGPCLTPRWAAARLRGRRRGFRALLP